MWARGGASKLGPVHTIFARCVAIKRSGARRQTTGVRPQRGLANAADGSLNATRGKISMKPRHSCCVSPRPRPWRRHYAWVARLSLNLPGKIMNRPNAHLYTVPALLRFADDGRALYDEDGLRPLAPTRRAASVCAGSRLINGHWARNTQTSLSPTSRGASLRPGLSNLTSPSRRRT